MQSVDKTRQQNEYELLGKELREVSRKIDRIGQDGASNSDVERLRTKLCELNERVRLFGKQSRHP
jgi:hypothetical protein